MDERDLVESVEIVKRVDLAGLVKSMDRVSLVERVDPPDLAPTGEWREAGDLRRSSRRRCLHRPPSRAADALTPGRAQHPA